MNAADVAAWVAAIGGGIALIGQSINIFRKRQKEKDEIEEALEQQPLVRQQLELGNVGEAVKHLNAIINSQASHIQSQENQLKKCNTRIEHLEDRNEALEAEASGWENKYRTLLRRLEVVEGDLSRRRRPHNPEE